MHAQKQSEEFKSNGRFYYNYFKFPGLELKLFYLMNANDIY